jgi:hypothetical protein
LLLAPAMSPLSVWSDLFFCGPLVRRDRLQFPVVRQGH